MTREYEREHRQAKSEGREAARNGAGPDANPYADRDTGPVQIPGMWEAWRAGWRAEYGYP